MTIFETIFLACFAVFAFVGITKITIGFGFLSRPAKKLVQLFRVWRNKTKAPKLKRYRTYGREFLMLLDKDVRGRCFENKSGWVQAGLCMLCLNPLLAVVMMILGNWYFVLSLVASVLSLFLLARTTIHDIRQRILLPEYRNRHLAIAQAGYDDAEREFNAALPPKGYRVAALPEASSGTLDQLRVIARDRRLPAELASDFEKLEQMQAELEAAEQAVTEAKNDEAPPTQKVQTSS